MRDRQTSSFFPLLFQMSVHCRAASVEGSLLSISPLIRSFSLSLPRSASIYPSAFLPANTTTQPLPVE